MARPKDSDHGPDSLRRFSSLTILAVAHISIRLKFSVATTAALISTILVTRSESSGTIRQSVSGGRSAVKSLNHTGGRDRDDELIPEQSMVRQHSSLAHSVY
jgi:hypothetical protein